MLSVGDDFNGVVLNPTTPKREIYFYSSLGVPLGHEMVTNTWA